MLIYAKYVSSGRISWSPADLPPATLWRLHSSGPQCQRTSVLASRHTDLVFARRKRNLGVQWINEETWHPLQEEKHTITSNTCPGITCFQYHDLMAFLIKIGIFLVVDAPIQKMLL